MNLFDPVNINFKIPATDPLGKNEVEGKVRFLADHVELSWRLKGSVFTGGKGDMTIVKLSYSEIESVELVKGWFSIKQLIIRVGDPQKVKDMPAISMGKMELYIDKKSKQEAKRLREVVDFKRSEFLLDDHDRRMKAIKDQE